MLRIIEAKSLPGYRLRVRYADGTAGEVDLSLLVGKGVFARWSEPGFFECVSLGESGELRWGDEIDLCPDALYMQLTGKTPDEVFPGLRATAAADA